MAEKKAKKAKKDGKTSSLLPKVIGGIKLPKDTRRKLTALAKHPVVADLLAAGLVALANRIKGEDAKPSAAPPPAPAEPAEPTATAEAPAKPAVKRIRKTAAKPAAAAEPASESEGAATAKPVKSPPPRRTRKTVDTAAKPRTRRTRPKTDG